MKRHVWLAMVTCLAYCLDQELWKAIEYLKEQVRVLKEQQEKEKRILLDNHQRMRLAAKAKQLIHDRDSLYTNKFDRILKAAGVEAMTLLPRSPDLNPHAERFVRSVKEECLSAQKRTTQRSVGNKQDAPRGARSEARSRNAPSHSVHLPKHRFLVVLFKE
jgi:transposase InsO family protein